MKSLFFMILLSAGIAMAQATGDATNGTVVALTNANNHIPMQLSAGVLGAAIFLIELAMRFFPTAKPRSVFILLSQIFGLIGSMFTKISSLLDSIVQNLKPDSK